jgi:DmsE family decaheme c-type cytochrome
MGDLNQRPVLIFLAAMALIGVGSAINSGANAQAPTPGTNKEVAATDYAGTEACASCHEDNFQKFQKNPHQVLNTNPNKGWQSKACEACHGPGEIHVETADSTKILSFNQLSTNRITEICLTCHARMEEHSGFASGLHGRSQVSCTDCHRIHETEQSVHLWAERSDQLCLTCHRENLAAFNKPFRHKYQEGAIHCVDCHQPHGGLNPRQVRLANGNEVACVKCHADKRGPFVFEHAPMRMEGCIACHEPHGSTNAKLLNRNQVYQLCLECHSTSAGTLAGQPPSFHDLRNPRFQNCTTCHLKIHGSNANPFFMR